MRNPLKNSGETWALVFWCALPILGQLTAPFYVLSAFFGRNREGAYRSDLLAFSSLCLAYVGYVAFVSLRVGDWSAASEPIGDAASLAITVCLATWVLRFRQHIDMGLAYRAAASMLIAVFLLTVVTGYWLNQPRPELLMKNPLNLGPTLLMPLLICTFWSFARSIVWQAIGALALFLGTMTVSSVLEARGTLLVLAVVMVARLFWVVFSPRPKGTKFRDGLLIAVPLILAGMATVIFNDKLERLAPEAFGLQVVSPAQASGVIVPDQEQTFVAGILPSDKSTNERLWMLQAGWKAFLDNPWLGYGAQNRFHGIRPYLPEGFPTYSHLHNDFLTHAIAGGVPAVLFLVVLLGFPILVSLRALRRRGDAFQLAVLCSAAFTGTALVNNVLFVDISAFTLGLSYLVLLLMIEATGSPKIS
ncbi:MAG: O-antigen ligase family protein [Pseudomonadota bacterium]